MNIKIVYFAYLIPDAWESIVLEQLDSLYSIRSLYEKSSIYMSVIDDSPSQKELSKLRDIIVAKYSKIQLVNLWTHNVYEYPGIKTIYEFSTNNEHEYLLYFHTKGMVSNMSMARKILFENTIQNYEVFINQMESNLEIDTASFIPSINGYGYFNFFWARSSYVNKYCIKPDCTESFMKYGRFSWEMWLGNQFSMKKDVITWSPYLQYKQVYDEYEANYLICLYHDYEQFKDITSSSIEEFNKRIKPYSKPMDAISDNSLTDKNTERPYFYIYEPLMDSKRRTAKNILEIGIYWGGSIQLWRDWFPKAQIYGVDIRDLDIIKKKSILNDNHITLFTNTDAYNDTFIRTKFQDMNIQFDMIIDDGPHTLLSNIQCIQKYLPLLSKDGILIIEDIQRFEWIQILSESVPEEFKKYIHIYDLRQLGKCRQNNLLFVINKTHDHI
jgi:hypothetical protein